MACPHVEGGQYISPEFLLGGEVYDGGIDGHGIVLYRPVYVTVARACDFARLQRGEQRPASEESSNAQGSTSSNTL